MAKRSKDLKWQKLDNTAKIYPVIASENLSGVYRMSITLSETIEPDILKEALDRVLPWFEGFQVRLRRGVFWYYFETNKKRARIEEETTYPCRYIDPYSNNQFLFRVTYFQCRINLEVFHALTDGYGAINFLKELTCQYLRIRHTGQFQNMAEGPTKDTSFNLEDSYLKNYKKMEVKGYTTKKAYQMEGDYMAPSVMGVIHGYLDLAELKKVCKQKGASITQYLTAVLVYCIYREYMHEQPLDQEIKINIPVNLRPVFDSTTTKNFFAVIFSGIKPKEGPYSFEDILGLIKEDFKRQFTKEHLEQLISYNVSNEANLLIRMIPLFIKNIGVKLIYNSSAKAFTTTLSNCGIVKFEPEFEKYIKNFHIIMGVSRKQPLKCAACSYGGQFIFTFSSVFTDTVLQRAFFRKIVQDGISVKIESNGVYHEEM